MLKDSIIKATGRSFQTLRAETKYFKNYSLSVS